MLIGAHPFVLCATARHVVLNRLALVFCLLFCSIVPQPGYTFGCWPQRVCGIVVHVHIDLCLCVLAIFLLCCLCSQLLCFIATKYETTERTAKQ